ncbi:MAG: adenylate/guanylate cyclase domain-containing protein, partial [Spirochaetales bacterium]|nr:adenylate/guanylate cyclase domain-containing protein [Spirochaetales bacterium]
MNETGRSAESVKIDDEQLRRDIERFYLPRHLVNAITEIGAIPNDSEEAIVGIGFLDIADYTFLSKFLSPNENQTVLNGLYSAFNWVLNKHGGYLNKLEGDSLMFQYGGPIDPNVRGLNDAEAEHYIAKELFYTCIELQRVCILFNQANDKFLYSEEEGTTKEEILKAFDIIRGLRNNEFLSPSINALFQIRIRIGASIGKVMIGNFGPEGSKHWDVIGMPVINAKRMESTAPIGGVRIS